MGPLPIVAQHSADELRDIDYRAGALLLIDKPLEWTSFQVVNKIRWLLSRHYGVKRLKVGHAGTLDPLASGLLLICTGKGTKSIESYIGLEKEYTGTFHLGATRPSYDMETEVDAWFATEHIDDALIEQSREIFLGDIMQQPPVFSAKKKDGKRAYKSARAGKEVKLDPCPVHISELEFTRFEKPELDFRVHCSKGTYIRSLAHDFGQSLESGAYLSALRRTSIGAFGLEDALKLDAFVRAFDKNPIKSLE